MTSLLIYCRCKKNVQEKTNCRFLMANRNKLLCESECNKTSEEGHYKTIRNKNERERGL